MTTERGISTPPAEGAAHPVSGTGGVDVAGRAVPVLAVDGLSVAFGSGEKWVRVLDDVSFSIPPGQALGLVGESGSGKTVASLAVMGLLPRRSARVESGIIRLDGRDLSTLTPPERRAIRGSELSMVFQEPMTSLNPAFTVGNQIAESVRIHGGLSRRAAMSRAVELLDLVGVPDPHHRVREYPHAFSGGMRQRAMIAMAVACEPRLMIADEPTTALDVTVQAQVLDLLARLQRELGMAMLLVSHDLGVVANMCDRVVVLYAGQVVEEGAVGPFFNRPRHPYARGLLDAMPQLSPSDGPLVAIPGEVPRPEMLPSGCRFQPRCAYAEAACGTAPIALEMESTEGASVRCRRSQELDLSGQRSEPRPEVAAPRPRVPDATGDSGSTTSELLRLSGLSKTFPLHSSILRRVVGHVGAVDGVDLTVGRGETLGLVGESGSGKSTVARLVMRLIEPTSGSVHLEGRELTGVRRGENRRALRLARRAMQMVFQDPYSSLDPKATVAAIIAEPLEVHTRLSTTERRARVDELLAQVGLNPGMARRYPHEFSGGQRQRIAIARALAINPQLVVCDEPISSLDVSTQSQVVNLLMELQGRLGLAYVFISHDLSIVRRMSHRIAVMYSGQIVELGPCRQVYERPTHPYTEALLAAIPTLQRHESDGARLTPLEGELPSPLQQVGGCRFHTRCPYALDICSSVEPAPFDTPEGTTVRCHLHTQGPELAGQPVRLARRAPAGG